MTIREKLLLAVARYLLLRPGDRVLVAVSGGQDSVALLWLLAGLRQEWGLGLTVGHLHHGLRGEAADRDQASVGELAARLGLAFVAEQADVAALGKQRGVGLEVAGREARYQFLERVAAQHDCARVALGHTATDRAETLLMNLFRGAGLAGLASIPPRRGAIIRPLILVTRQETGDYCRSEGLAVCEDGHNREARFRRNRVRGELLPRLEQEYGPGVAEALSRAADHVLDELEWTEPLVEEAWERCRGDDGLRVAAARELPSGLRQRVLRRLLQAAGHPLSDISAERWQALDHVLRQGQTGKRVELPDGWSVHLQYGVMRAGVGGAPEAADGEPVETRLSVPGSVTLGDETAVRAELADQSPAGAEADRGLAVLDADRAGAELLVRRPRPGDRFVPSGMTGHKKLQDYFVDNKVPPEQRHPWLLVGNGAVLWVVGHRLAETARPTKDTRRLLVVTVRAGGGQA